MTEFETWVQAHWTRHSGCADVESLIDERYAMTHPGRCTLIAAMGLMGEAGEAGEHFKKAYRDGKFDREAALYELGDVLHYLCVLIQSCGSSFEEVIKMNREKLETRYDGPSASTAGRADV